MSHPIINPAARRLRRLCLAALALGGLAPGAAHAINDSNLGPVEDPATAGIATVLGGDFEEGCLGAVVDARWVLTLDSVVHGVPRSCLGAAGTTVQVGAQSFAVVDAVHGESYARRAGEIITPVLLRVAAPMQGVTVHPMHAGVVAETNGAHRGLRCTGRREGALRSSLVEIGWHNYLIGGATWYRSENNGGITVADRGAVLSMPLDAGAPCWVGDRLAAMVAIMPEGSTVYARADELATDAFAGWVGETIANYRPCDLAGQWEKRYDMAPENGVVDGTTYVNQIELWADRSGFTGRYIGAAAGNRSVFSTHCVERDGGAEVRIVQNDGWYWAIIEATRVGDEMTGVWYDRSGNRGDITLGRP